MRNRDEVKTSGHTTFTCSQNSIYRKQNNTNKINNADNLKGHTKHNFNINKLNLHTLQKGHTHCYMKNRSSPPQTPSLVLKQHSLSVKLYGEML